jgi:hypothetical protein
MATSVDITRIQNQTSSSAVGLKLNAFIQDFMQSTNKGLLTQNLYKDLGKNIPTTVKYLGEALDRRINKKSADNRRYLIVHNIGYGQEISDCLFMNKITGHYRYKKTK